MHSFTGSVVIDDLLDYETINGHTFILDTPSGEHMDIERMCSGLIGLLVCKQGRLECIDYVELHVMLLESDVKPSLFVRCAKGVERNVRFVIEIFGSRELDVYKTLKFELYKDYGVEEYWVIDSATRTLQVHDFKNGNDVCYTQDGVFFSEFWQYNTKVADLFRESPWDITLD